jgi:YVTN family beta-propeller protein
MEKKRIENILVAILLLSTAFAGIDFSSISANGAPVGIVYQVPVYIYNTQSVATPGPFQQMVKIPISTFSNYIYDNNASANFEFYYTNNTIIPAWIESVNATTIVVWLKLYSIPASTKITIYLGFASKSTNLLSSSGTTGIGEAPQLSPTYGQYDDGASVFNFYDNFVGTSLNTNNWITVSTPSSGVITVNNGVSIIGTSNNIYYVSSKSFAAPYIIDINGKYGDYADNGPWFDLQSTTSTANTGYLWATRGSSARIGYDMLYTDANGNYNIFAKASGYSGTSSFVIYTLEDVGGPSGIIQTYVNYASWLSGASTTYTHSGYFDPFRHSNTNTPVSVIYWVRVRACPPNGVMPSVSFGPISFSGYTYAYVNSTVTYYNRTSSQQTSAINTVNMVRNYYNAYVANSDDNTVSVIGLSNNTVWKTISVGEGAGPVSIAVSSTNAYVLNSASLTISVIGLSNNTIWKTIELNTNLGYIAISSTNMYVSNPSIGDTVSVIGLSNNTVWKTISVGSRPADIAISSTNVYVLNVGSNTVSVIGLSNNTVWKTIKVGTRPGGIAISSTNVYVANSGDGTVSVIGLSNNTVWKTISIGTRPYAIAITSTNAYVVSFDDNTVSIIGLTNNTVWKTISAGKNPYAIAVTSTNAYVTNYGDNTVSIIGLSNNTVWKTIPVGTSPEGIAISSGFSSQVSSFSSQVPPNYISYSIYWSAQQNSIATYNSNTYTTSPITGVVNVYSISFSQNFAYWILNPWGYGITSYLISYYEIFINYYIYSQSTQTNSTTVTYFIVQGNVGVYFNATFSFNFKIVSSSLFTNTTYPISWKINVSHLLNYYYSAPYNTFTYSITYSNYSRTILGSNSAQYWNFISYTNWTNSNGANITWTVSTYEIANYYPSITYKIAKWTGVGSTEKLIVNVSNTFPSETLQITNINWGDGSPTTSSSIVTAQKGYYNFTFTHSYTALGTFTITFQVVNMVNTIESLSTSDFASITISLTITTYPSNTQTIPMNSYLYFNWTGQNIGIQKVVGLINNIQVLSSSFNNLTSGSVSYYQTQTTQFTMTWVYYAGSYKSSVSITYVLANNVPSVGKWVLVNYTLGTGPNAVKESVPYFYSQTVPYNVTWSYFVWQIILPSNAVNITVKGNPMWKNPIISVPANYNITTATFTLLENVSMFQVTWLAQNPTYNALIIIEYYPQTALFGQFGVTLPFSAFYTYLNGQQIYSPVQTVDLGSTIVINTTTIYRTLLSSYRVTVTQQTQFIEIPLNILPITIENLNSSYVIGLQVQANNITQTAQYIMPLQSVTFFVPAGTYNFTFNYIQFNTYTVVKSFTAKITISSVSYYLITGVTLSQLSLSIQESQNNITNLVENVNISFLISNSKIINQIINLNLNLTNVNSTITKQQLNINTTVNNILSKIMNIENTINIIENNIMSNVNKTLLNTTTKILTIKSLLLFAMNSSILYKFTPGIAQPNGSYVDIPIYATTLNGVPLNLSMTESVAKNISVQYISAGQEYTLWSRIIKIQPGMFIIQLNMNDSMKSAINSGNATIVLCAPVKTNNYTSTIAGVIGNSNFPQQEVNYPALLFTISFGILNLWWLILFILIIMLYFVLKYQRQVSKTRPSRGSLAVGAWVFVFGSWLILFYSEPLIMTNSFNLFNTVIFGISPFILFTALYLIEFWFVIQYARKIKKPSQATIALGLWALGFLFLYILLFLHIGGVI